MIKSYCGMDCEKCMEYPDRCPGCSIILGKPLWAKGLEGCKCPIYSCCTLSRQLSSCEECHESVCHVKEVLAGC